MATDMVNVPSSYLRQICPDAGQAFRDLRNAVGKSGPLDQVTCEYVLMGSFAAAGFEDSFKIHGTRLLKQGVPAQALRQVVLVLLAATVPMFTVTTALHWVDDIVAEQGGDK